eukprot:2652442-Lingulodinium_polyedra.AAC.1
MASSVVAPSAPRANYSSFRALRKRIRAAPSASASACVRQAGTAILRASGARYAESADVARTRA